MTKDISLSEVAKHATEKDCWVVINGEVLDITAFLSEHPGGKEAIMMHAGADASEEFNMMHEENYTRKYCASAILGRLKGEAKL